mmetsp:Transcript_105646/g.251924  ORF Transcript_105646/g.251924 Transcript_105646/m.251924 type:complete len:267 (+) Transcript_105646:452-1252(+)
MFFTSNIASSGKLCTSSILVRHAPAFLPARPMAPSRICASCSERTPFSCCTRMSAKSAWRGISKGFIPPLLNMRSKTVANGRAIGQEIHSNTCTKGRKWLSVFRETTLKSACGKISPPTRRLRIPTIAEATAFISTLRTRGNVSVAIVFASSSVTSRRCLSDTTCKKDLPNSWCSGSSERANASRSVILIERRPRLSPLIVPAKATNASATRAIRIALMVWTTVSILLFFFTVMVTIPSVALIGMGKSETSPLRVNSSSTSGCSSI